MSDKRVANARKQLVDATIESLYRYGLSETSVATVTAIADLSRGMVRHCFSTKNAMMAAAYQTLRADWTERFLNAREGDPLERILRMVESMFVPPNFSPQHISAWMAFSAAALHDKELRKLSREDNAAQQNAIEEELRAYAKQSKKDLDIERIVGTIMATADGLWSRHLIEPERVTPEIARDIMVEMILDLLKVSKATRQKFGA